jgi:DNA polymerase III subunit gamma/tau
VRELRDRIAFAPGEGKYRVYIIDEVHRFSGNAFDALLKTLEEPPEHALFILATTEIDKVPATIKSRCLPFEFRRLSMTEVADRLEAIAHTEGLNIERAALELIAREGTGSARDSISLLDQVVADPAEAITLELTQRILGTASVRAVRELVEALVQQDAAQGLHIINQAVDTGSDPRQFCQQMVEQLRSILLAQTAGTDLLEASQEDKQTALRLAGQIGRAALMRTIRAFNDALNSDMGGWQPQLALELALIESLQEPEVVATQPLFAPQAANSSGASPFVRDTDPAPQPTAPGEPAVVPAQQVRERWADVQRLIQQNVGNRSDMKTLPDLMYHAHVISVDGNRLLLGTGKFYLKQLNDAERIRWIQRALLRILGVDLIVKFVLSETGGSDMRYITPSPDAIINDPLIETGAELGADIEIKDD